MKRNRKPVRPAPVAAKPQGVDLGALQNDFITARRELKGAATKLANAQDLFDGAKAKFAAASDKLKAGSRAVVAEG